MKGLGYDARGGLWLRVEDLKCLVGYEIVSLGIIEECQHGEAQGVRLWAVGLKVRGFRRFRV